MTTKPKRPHKKTASPQRLQRQAFHGAQAVFQVAHRVFTEGKPADRELASFFRSNRQFGSNDRRFVSETLFALCRWWGWLQLLCDDTEKLWVGEAKNKAESYQWQDILLAANLLDSEQLHPVAAVWKEALFRRHKHRGYLPTMGGLPIAERAQAFANLYGIATPRWQQLVPSWFPAMLPDRRDAEAIITTLQERPPLWLRAQNCAVPDLVRELNDSGLRTSRSKHLSWAINGHRSRTNLYELDAYRHGRVEVQDLASQVIGVVCAAKPQERWWDACAGAGGKALQLAAMMKNQGTIVASDIRAYKLDDLRKRARRAKFSNISPRPWDGEHLPAKPGSFDGVLVDSPCSCTGTWRRNPDARWRLNAEEVAELATLQEQILNKAAEGVRKDGALIYATCSLCVAENNAVVDRFLASHGDFALEPTMHPLTREMTDGRVWVLPQMADSDGIFVARIRRGRPQRRPMPAAAKKTKPRRKPAKARKKHGNIH